jgi:adenine-specific DNA-methyltransferase
MRTELVWDGKYDEYGRRRSVDVAGAACPGHKIETVDMPRSEALASGQTTLGELSTTVREDFRIKMIRLRKSNLCWKWLLTGICGGKGLIRI